MWYRAGADLVVLIHFLWVVFMAVGGVATVWAVLAVWLGKGKSAEKARRFFGWRVFRTVHVCGIVYAGALSAMGKYCPLTYLENYLRRASGAGSEYPGSFIVHYVEKVLYPHVEPGAIVVLTVLLAVVTVIVYFVRPCWKMW